MKHHISFYFSIPVYWNCHHELLVGMINVGIVLVKTSSSHTSLLVATVFLEALLILLFCWISYSAPLWGFVVAFILFNVKGNSFLASVFLPLKSFRIMYAVKPTSLKKCAQNALICTMFYCDLQDRISISGLHLFLSL